jgi:RNA-directed DNA polymerase
MTKPTITTQELQRRIGNRAKSAPEHRFWGLYVHLVKIETLEAAYLEAKRNGGAPGFDGETFKAIEERGRAGFLAELAAELRAGTYSPRPYRRREIPKEGGKVRVISIPAIRDRVVQGALRLLLEPIFEADFSRHSFGARPGRSAHDAIGEVRSGMMYQKHLVLDVDLKSFFDDIRHAPVLAKVARRVCDERVLLLIKQFLKSTGERGIPQGSPLSPLLANVMLNDLDHALARGYGYLTYARYLDDMVILTYDSVKGRRWAARALERIREEAKTIGVSLNMEKTRTVRLTEPGTSFAEEERHRGSAEGSGHAAGQPAPQGATSRRPREPDRPRMGELLPSRQLEPRIRHGADRSRAESETIRGEEAEAKGFRLDEVE